MPEIAGIPAEGPTTLALVKAMLTVDDAADDDQLTAYVGAANALVRSARVAQEAATTPPVWPPYVVVGTTMLAARWWRRKGSPSGVETVGDFGAVYVMRNDPDIGMMLKLGNYAPPGVG